MNCRPDDHLDNEWYLVRHSGETPEIALYSALHFLTEAEDGPRLVLTGDQLGQLKEAAAERYREIILRDLQPENRGKTIYRGIKRSIVNYQRFSCFCRRQGLDGRAFKKVVAASLLVFLARESVERTKSDRPSSLNCSFLELNDFARKVGLVEDSLPRHMEALCPE